jgi:hypothetical protein
MVSMDNVDGMIDLPAMERVVGGTFMYDLGGDLQQSLHMPIRFIPNAISQAGFTHLTTEGR